MSLDSNPSRRGPTTASDSQRRYIRLLSTHQKRIGAYLYTLIPNRADADDLLQEVLITLWEKFDEYDPERDFMAWALKIAYFHARNARRKYARSPVIHSDALLSMLAEETAAAIDQFDQRHEALQGCLQKLGAKDRDLILARYQADTTVKEMAEGLDRPVKTLYQRLARIRRDLFDCVTSTLRGGAS